MADRYSNQQIPAPTGAFSDPRVILVRMDDSRLASLPRSECHIEQSFDTPTYVAIGGGATDEQLEKVSGGLPHVAPQVVKQRLQQLLAGLLIPSAVQVAGNCEYIPIQNSFSRRIALIINDRIQFANVDMLHVRSFEYLARDCA